MSLHSAEFRPDWSILSGDMMLYWFSRWRPLRLNFISSFGFGDFALFRMSVSISNGIFRSYNSMHSWDITISDFEKQTSAILEFYFWFRFRLYHWILGPIMGSLKSPCTTSYRSIDTIARHCVQKKTSTFVFLHNS